MAPSKQVPFDRLPTNGRMAYKGAMHDGTFRAALRWHMEKSNTTIAELAKATGVSEDTLKKIRSRHNASTKAENASKIAAFFGKDVSAFLQCRDVDDAELGALLDLLTEEERRFLLAQVRGLLAGRDK